MTGSSKALVVRGRQSVLVTDIMGSLIVTLAIPSSVKGQPAKIYTIHSQLLCGASETFADYIGQEPDQTMAYPLANVTVEVFDLFVTTLYGRWVPDVDPKSSAVAQALRIKQLCQLYTFADLYKVTEEIKEKILTAIKEGFVIMNRFPEFGLAQNIYKNTEAGSKIRKFCVDCILFTFIRDGTDLTNGSLQQMFVTSPEFMEDFMQAIRTSIGDKLPDPRVVCVQASVQQ